MIQLVIILIVAIVPDRGLSASILQPYVTIMETGSFLQYLTDIGEDVASCSASFFQDKEEFSFTLDTKSMTVPLTEPDNFEDENELFERLFSLGQNLCGFKLINWTNGDPSDWMLASVDTLNNRNEASFEVAEYSQNLQYSSIKVNPGYSAIVFCGVMDGTESKEFCKIFNPSGGLVYNGVDCKHNFIVTMEDIGEWRCLVGVHYSMDLVEYIIEVILDDVPHTNSWVTETDDYYNIGCQIVQDKDASTPRYCVITNPSGQDYVIRHGKTTERYNTITTNLNDRICGIEIPKPLEESEYGLWKCRIRNSGEFIDLSKTTGKSSEIPRYDQNLTKSTNLGAYLEISCEVPHSVIYCHITTPNGERRLTNKDSMELGVCTYYITTVSAEDLGTWTCSLVREGTSMLETTRIEVKITDLLVYSNGLITDKDESLELQCKTGGVPIEYCLYTTPQNELYYVYETLNTSGITYIGEGLNYGDCTVVINKITAEHFGNWSCIISIGNKEVTGVILVSAKSVLSGTSLGLVIAFSIVLGIILIAVLIAVIYKFIRKRTYEEPETVVYNRSSNRRESEQGIASVTLPNYNTDVRQRR